MKISTTRLRADLILLLVAFIWGSAFVAQRVAAQHMGVFLFNGLRFLLGSFLLLPWSLRRGRPDRQAIPWVALAGGLLFVGSALQQAGLKFTTAGNAGFITTLYVVLVPILLLVLFRQKLHWISWAAAVLAVVGMLLLSTGGALRLAPGDGLELLGAVAWALHVIVVGKAARRIDILLFSVGQFIVAGTLSLIVGLAFEWRSSAGLAEAWWTVLYIGVFSTAIGYTLQAMGQRHSPPADAAIILSMESVFAALFGFLLLDERLVAVQILGCGLILLAILMAQTREEPASNLTPPAEYADAKPERDGAASFKM
jgi:drug/metabolite transporter (DMT)-like permease